MKRMSFRLSLKTLGLMALSSLLFAGSQAEAGYLIASGDSNIINGLNGSDILPVTPGNKTFFSNILGSGTTVKILSTTMGSNVDNVNLEAVANTFYNSLSGVTSTIVSTPITSALLSGTNLFIDDLPDAVLTAAEVTAVKNFLAGGGTFFLLGENSAFTPTQNGYINADLTALGSGLQLTSASIDPNVNTATVANGQILSNPLTSGITTLSYAYTTGVTGGQKLFLDSDKTTSFLSAELQPSVAVPEPSSIVMVAMAMTGLALTHRRQRTRRSA